ncbi:MAG: DUF402 domain-containing protein [Gemmatimonadota bacterium]
MSERIRLRYRRPPERVTLFDQDLLYESDDVLITFLADTPLERALIVDGSVVLEPGSPVVWFTFPGLMHDIGRFHRADGTFTGLYANIIEPVERASRLEWNVIDLFVDVWLAAREAGAKTSEPRVLDRAELEAAVERGWISAAQETAANAEADRLIRLWRGWAGPPRVVNEWPITRVVTSL